MNFPEFLRDKMLENHETAYRLAKEIGVTQTTVANWLEGRSFPQLAHLGKLEAHYHCEIAKEDRPERKLRSGQEKSTMATKKASEVIEIHDVDSGQ